MEETKKGLTPIEELDKVLEHLNENSLAFGTPQEVRNTQSYIYDDLKKKGIEIEYSEMVLVLGKLGKDGYINIEDRPSHKIYSINFEGRLFIQRGKYNQEEQDKIAKRKAKENYAARTVSNAHRLTVGTWCLVGATIFLAVMEFLKHDTVYNLFRCCCKYH